MMAKRDRETRQDLVTVRSDEPQAPTQSDSSQLHGARMKRDLSVEQPTQIYSLL